MSDVTISLPLPCGFTLRLPVPPDRINARRHWAVQRRIENEWKVRALVEMQNSRLKPRQPLRRFTVHATVYAKRKIDADNACTRMKVPIDFLKKCGWIVDDSPDHLTSLTVVPAVDAKWPRIELHVCEDL